MSRTNADIQPRKSLLRKCSVRARYYQVLRHIPPLKSKAHASHYGATPILSTEDGRAVMVRAIQEQKPFMAARFGTSEGAELYHYWRKKLRCLNTGDEEKIRQIMCSNAGFFPDDPDLLDRWSEEETNACADLDLLGCMDFLGEEWIYRTFCRSAQLMPAGGLASASKGWAWALEGKRVLVIHPFTDTIQSQYQFHRAEIYPGTNALPQFDLQCIKAVQTIADSVDTRFDTWFDALDYMADEAAKREFDIALIGCGAYGFQLASRIKRMGKVAIHMGGCLQTLFGIKGSRWDNKYGSMYNDAWVYPSESETPAGFEKIENGCYWKKE